MKLEFFRQIFEKSSNIKFHENPFCGNRVVPGWRMDRQAGRQAEGRIDMTKLLVAFRKFVKAPKKRRQ